MLYNIILSTKMHLCKVFIYLLLCFGCTNVDAKQIKVRVSQSASHIALDSTTQGIHDAFKDAGYDDTALDFAVESAQSNVVLASQIATKFSATQADIIFSVGTLSSLSFLKLLKTNNTAVIFASVTDPLQSGIIADMNCRPQMISGVSNYVGIEPQIDLILRVQPNLKKIGIIYNSGESNSLSIVKKLRDVAKSKGLILIEQTVTKTSEISQAATKLSREIDAFFVSNDNTCLSGFQSIVQVARKNQKPIYCSDTDQVAKGALMAYGPNQYMLGKQAAKMALKLVQKSDSHVDSTIVNASGLKDMPVEFPNDLDLVINETVAAQLKIEIPMDLRQQAKELVKG